MLLVLAAAILDVVALVPFHREAADAITGLNAVLAVVAVVGYLILGRWRWPTPEVIVVIALAAVDAAIVLLGTAHHALGIVSVGYLLLLPTIVALVIPWATRTHVAWLGLHAVFALTYAAVAPPAAFGGASADRITLLAVALGTSLLGHLAGLRGRVVAFVQIERIRALNRRAMRDAATLDRLNTVLAQTARTDPLTDLRNRRHLEEDLVAIRANVTREGQRWGVLLLDLDHFKAINDVLGHIEGDRILKMVADEIRRSIRPDDGAYRYGGEEFAILMRVATEPDALSAAERIRVAIAALGIEHAGNPPYGRLTMSIGVTVVGTADLALDDRKWLERADEALYMAKANGRNRTELTPTGGTHRTRTRP
jgi:diguanylate cyclase (GGDEF)-like protein